MAVLTLENVVKQYENHKAVDGVSFDIDKGTIFGLLGPNGAGKTSLIRIITSITHADSGKIYFNGELLNNFHPLQIGYLPEERGLYKKMKVGDHLLLLAQLKGLKRYEAIKKINHWLEKFEIKDWWNKKIQELSKGMAQKVQFISTVVHEPKLLILDEPFSGLDPINTNLIKEEINDLYKNGTSIIFSTHRMEQVEEICKEIVLINKGKVILNGKVDQVKNDHKENKFRIKYEGSLNLNQENQSGYQLISAENNEAIFKLNAGFDSNQLLSQVMQNGARVIAFNEIKPSLNEIFINIVEESDE